MESQALQKFLIDLFTPIIEKAVHNCLDTKLSPIQQTPALTPEDDYTTIAEFADDYGISLPTAQKYINQHAGVIHRYRFSGGRKVWLKKSEIEQALGFKRLNQIHGKKEVNHE